MERFARLLAVGVIAVVMVVPSGFLAQGPGPSAGGRAPALPSGESAGAPVPAASAASSAPVPNETANLTGIQSPQAPTPSSSCQGPTASLTPLSAPGGSPSGKPPSGTNKTLPSTDPTVEAVVAKVVAAGACENTLFPPRAPATAAQFERARSQGTVYPLYSASPAPMGLADYGLTVAGNGSVSASTLDTTRLLGLVEANATGIEPLDLYNTQPDSYSIQLNAVLTGVTLFGRSGYEFWAQDVVEYYVSAHELVLITNVWNFSGFLAFGFGPAIYSHGPYGQLYDGEVYVATVAYPNISYPFDLSLYTNSTLVGGRDAVEFSDVLTGPGEAINAPTFDYVVFNSTRPGGHPLTVPAEFSANGSEFDPMGLTNDFELDVGGPGGGSQASLAAADAELGLAYWNAAANGGAGGYVSVPSAYSYGGETAETSTGATVTWSDAGGGPAGLSTYGTMTTGPSFLTGLWNASGAEGSYPVTIESSPSNAFEVVTPAANPAWTQLTWLLQTIPGPRSAAQEAYDPALGATVLFGGYSPILGGVLNDTWEFASGQWTELSEPVAPPARADAALVYDAADGYLLLFGGTKGGPTGFMGDTWIFNATGWHRLNETAAPSPRAYAAVAYDATDGEVVLFGGGRGTVYSHWSLLSDTWTFRGGAWTNITSTAGTAPPGRIEGSMAYDATDGYALLVGGAVRRNYTDSCPDGPYELPGEWAFSGGQWSLLAPAGTPPPAGAGSLWFDSATQTTYYYEGAENVSAGNCMAFVGDVWSYAAGAWTLVEAGNASGSPTPRIFATVVDDVADHVELLFGGQEEIDGPWFFDSWAFDPSAAGPSSPPSATVDQPSVGPTITTNTFWLAPGNYSLWTEYSDFSSQLTILDVTGPLTVDPVLAAAPSLGVYTPLWAWTNGQLGAVATSGSGIPSDPYVLPRAQSTALASMFGLFNDDGYLVYPGLFLLDTTASVDVIDPPSFDAGYSYAYRDGNVVPVESIDLSYWFWNVSGVALVRGVHLGDAGPSYSFPLEDANAPFPVIFYDSSGNLIAGNSFENLFGGDVLLESGPDGGPFTGPGGSNTIWGNAFFNPFSFFFPPATEAGLAVLESNDLIYNNYFDTYFTACQPGNPAAPNDCWPIYALAPVSLNSTWNVTAQPASVIHYAAGFPTFPLNGSVIKIDWQGGNWWWDYGRYPNVYGVLPYDENDSGAPFYLAAFITPGGDYAPLVPAALYKITFVATGLPSSLTWGADVASNNYLYDVFTTTTTEFSIYLPNTTAYYLANPPTGYVLQRYFGVITVQGSDLRVTLTFNSGPALIEFEEEGLPAGTLARYGWTVDLNGTLQHVTTTALDVTAPGGVAPVLTYGPPDFQAVAIDYYCPSPSLGCIVLGVGGPVSGYLRVRGPMTLEVSFVPGPTYTLGFVERGLAKGASWCVELDGDAACSRGNAIAYPNLMPGSYAYGIVSPLTGQEITVTSVGAFVPTSGVIDLQVGNTEFEVTFVYPVPLTFTVNGLPGGTEWCVKVGSMAQCSTGGTITFTAVNGTYSYGAGAVAGYFYAGPSVARVKVVGPTTVVIKYLPRHRSVVLYGPSSVEGSGVVPRAGGADGPTA